MEKEAKFTASLKAYIKEHGRDDLFLPVKPKRGKLLPVTLPDVEPDLKEFEKDVKESIQRHKKLYTKFKHLPHIEWLIHRYDILGYFSNISLSVSPKIKQKWGITHEMFGAFYNTDYPYYSLFPDLEGSLGTVFQFKPKKSMVVLVNPPYTAEWIKWTCNKIIELKGKATFYVILPVWDRKTRKELGLKQYADLPEIQELIAVSRIAEVTSLPFYDGIHQREILLKDPVHVIVV